MQYSRFFVLLGSVFLVLLYVFSHVVFIHSIQGWSGFSVELATNQKAWEFGLMNREYLADNHGMLFIFPSAKIESFWMKDTLIPLDLVFLNAQKQVVQIVENAHPCLDTSGETCPVYTSNTPVQYVLELKAGQTKAKQVLVGDQLYSLLN